MKSIGFFWTNSKEENECCRKCPHLRDDTTQSNSASNEQTGDEFEFQINLWNSDVKSTVTNEKYRFRAVDFGIVCPLSIRKFVLLLPFKAQLANGEIVWIHAILIIFSNKMGILKLELPLIDTDIYPLKCYDLDLLVNSIDNCWKLIAKICWI